MTFSRSTSLLLVLLTIPKAVGGFFLPINNNVAYPFDRTQLGRTGRLDRIEYANNGRHVEEKEKISFPIFVDRTSTINTSFQNKPLKSTPLVPIPLHRRRSSWKSPVHTKENVCSQTGVTLSRYMMEMVQLNPELEHVLSIVTSLQVACKAISKLVRNASLEKLTGLAGGNINVQGEEQKKLDVMANDVLKKALAWTGRMSTLVSEEDSLPVSGGSSSNSSKTNKGNFKQALIDSGDSFIAVFDPLDGSSNIDAGIPVGTIFGVFEPSEECPTTIPQHEPEEEETCMEDVLQPGSNLVAAGYCLYSSATTLVLTLGNGDVNGFTLDETLGEFVLTHPNMKIPSRGKIYSFNEGNRWDWDAPTRAYINAIQQGKGETGFKYSGRYVGSMVADIHRTLQYGGIFGYPADVNHPEGKLRLLYEAAPMSFLMEQAGGMSVAPQHGGVIKSIMNIEPSHVHQRVPCIMGSMEDVKELCSYYRDDQHDATIISIDDEEDYAAMLKKGVNVRCENGVCWLSSK